MASDTDICNLALAHLGDTATVSSIDPPEGSAQASHCARFYPIARDALLEMHAWGFATKRASLALLDVTPPSTWQYTYAAPADILNFLEVLAPEARDDYSVGLPMANTGAYAAPITNLGVYTPQAFAVENIDGTDVLYCNVENAVLRYTGVVTDTTRFSPLFVRCLAHYLASMLAGPLLKGEVGRKVAQEHLRLAMAIQQQAEGSDANQRNIKPAHGAPWMTGR